MKNPERAPIIRKAFEDYATGRFTKRQVLERVTAAALRNRRDKALTAQTAGNGRSGSRFEMALREGPARAGLQVPLESQGCLFCRELDSHVQGPWPIPHRMRTTAGIVVGKANHARPP